MTQTIKILFLAANPAEMDPLQLGRESRAIDLALRTTHHRDRFVLEDHWAVQPRDLQELLLRHEPQIVLFSGHGLESNSILLVGDNGQAYPVNAATLGELFGHFAERVRCVVLNACYSDQQARQIAQHVDCVIGVADLLSDEDAIAFSAAFYRSLGYGKSVQLALGLARNEVALGDRPAAFQPELIALSTDPASLVLIKPTDGAPSPSATSGSSPTPPAHAEESHPALGQMATGASRLMWLVLGLLAVGLLVLIGLPLLMGS